MKSVDQEQQEVNDDDNYNDEDDDNIITTGVTKKSKRKVPQSLSLQLIRFYLELFVYCRIKVPIFPIDAKKKLSLNS